MRDEGVRRGPRVSFVSQCPSGNSQYWTWCRSAKGGYAHTVLATIIVNSSKLSLPSPSLSASMIVLSTISWSCESCESLVWFG